MAVLRETIVAAKIMAVAIKVAIGVETVVETEVAVASAVAADGGAADVPQDQAARSVAATCRLQSTHRRKAETRSAPTILAAATINAASSRADSNPVANNRVVSTIAAPKAVRVPSAPLKAALTTKSFSPANRSQNTATSPLPLLPWLPL